jgi:hypothetical protein
MPTGDQEALMDAARQRTGLDDFGDDSFREGLAILVRSLHREANLHAAGERFLSNRISVYLEQRLQIEAWYRRHPEIDDEIIRAPLIGLGLPRTGSTALSCLLAEDHDARSLRRWEAAEPCPPPGTVQPPDPRIQRDAERHAAHRSHTPSNASGAVECQDLMALDFKAQIFLAFARMPTYAQWLLHADLTSTYAYERRVLKLLQWRQPTKPWRLKAPTHILYLEHLNRAFPDARFVMTHRDPTEVVLSVAAVYADIGGNFTDHVDRSYFGALNVEQWSVGIRRVLAFRDGGADARFYDIDFRAMQRDPIGEVRSLYRWLGQDVSRDFEARMTLWWQGNTAREPSSRADPRAFGIELDEIRPLFAEYTHRAAEWTAQRGASNAH